MKDQNCKKKEKVGRRRGEVLMNVPTMTRSINPKASLILQRPLTLFPRKRDERKEGSLSSFSGWEKLFKHTSRSCFHVWPLHVRTLTEKDWVGLIEVSKQRLSPGDMYGERSGTRHSCVTTHCVESPPRDHAPPSAPLPSSLTVLTRHPRSCQPTLFNFLSAPLPSMRTNLLLFSVSSSKTRRL